MNLRIYPVVLELVRRLAPYLPLLRARSSSLGEQMERALISMPLNVAEGAREVLARLETAEALGWVKPLEPELAALFHRVIGTLVRLVEPKGEGRAEAGHTLARSRAAPASCWRDVLPAPDDLA